MAGKPVICWKVSVLISVSGMSTLIVGFKQDLPKQKEETFSQVLKYTE